MFLQICKWAVSTQPDPPIKDVVIETTVTEISDKRIMGQEQDGQTAIKDYNSVRNTDECKIFQHLANDCFSKRHELYTSLGQTFLFTRNPKCNII